MREYLKLYLIADYLYFDDKFYDKVKLAIRGGVTAVQFRFKGIEDKVAFEIGTRLRDICAELNVPFFVNNRPDFALLLGADGVHVGQEDLNVDDVRRILPGRIIGVSVGSEEEYKNIKDTDFDYLSFGSVFATSTKSDAGEPLGLDGLRRLVAISGSVPKIAIGGITLDNVKNVVECGVDGVAVASAILTSGNVEKTAKRFREIIG
ncbi:MAG: thiamine phosphate synthase [Candidatus Hydrothermia bacterium]|jgi:thiamine-phosphate pyrophosphorylase